MTATQIVTALEAALRNAGHDADVPTDPTVDDLARLCGLLDVKVSELMASIERTGCPSWCSSHPRLERAAHVGHLRPVEDITLDLCQELGQPVTIYCPDDVAEGMTAERAATLGRALLEAARLIEGGEQR